MTIIKKENRELSKKLEQKNQEFQNFLNTFYSINKKLNKEKNQAIKQKKKQFRANILKKRSQKKQDKAKSSTEKSYNTQDKRKNKKRRSTQDSGFFNLIKGAVGIFSKDNDTKIKKKRKSNSKKSVTSQEKEEAKVSRPLVNYSSMELDEKDEQAIKDNIQKHTSYTNSPKREKSTESNNLFFNDIKESINNPSLDVTFGISRDFLSDSEVNDSYSLRNQKKVIPKIFQNSFYSKSKNEVKTFSEDILDANRINQNYSLLFHN